MKITDQYKNYFRTSLNGRYITLKHLLPHLNLLKKEFKVLVAGYSELGKEIIVIKIGHGNKKVLAWSQMHGNESTTTKAIFDFLNFFSQKKAYQEQIQHFLEKYTLYIVPMLNPDGASLYTRENANGIDLNRDAQQLSQKESQVLRNLFDKFQPNLCLNLHDQRTIYGFDTGKQAVLSFLSPAASVQRELTPARLISMELIEKMNRYLQLFIPNQIGRYDDTFNSNCVGDTFQMEGVPTILFEAGQYQLDYNREKSREFIFYALLSLFDLVSHKKTQKNSIAYSEIPENKKNFKDIIIRNAKITNSSKLRDIAIQYQEILVEEALHFIPKVNDIGDLKSLYALLEINAEDQEVLINSQKSINIGDNISRIMINNINFDVNIQ